KSKGRNNAQGAVDELTPKKRNPSLHILAVGSADYAGAELDLQYAAKDAREMAAALEQVGKQLFVPAGGRVTVHLLTTDDSTPPTKTAIKVAFDTINAQAKAEDVVVVYFSGHGITYGDEALFYYLTRDIGSFDDLGTPGVREKRAISSRELTQWLKVIPPRKQVLILDACNSGKMVEDLAAGKKALSASQIRALDRLKDRTGMFVLAGSAADKVSYEAGQYGQGLLTFRLLQGMNGMALLDGKTVDVMTLFQDACNEVPELAKGIGGIQRPMLVGPVKGSFPIGIKNEQVNIPIADPKPVFIRNVFMDELTFDDGLGLTDALEDHFRELTVKGAQAELIFVDVKEYPEAYAIKGQYKVKGEAVEVRGRLYKGKTNVGDEFKISGQKNDLPGLTNAIYEKVLELLKL
ncbi:MAG: caspase family protein, partial [Saprospiraceae bacterium]|nr:caspase family protein [Saprospiraceae bacterium]